MRKSQGADLVKRYEEMLVNNASIYFDADEFEDIAFQYELSENYQQAFDTIVYALKIHSGNSELLVKKALYLLCLEHKEEALELIDSLPINNVPNDLIKADIYLANGKELEAIAIVDKVLEITKPDFTLYLDASDVFANNDSLEYAILYLKKGLEVFPEQTDLMRELAFTYGDSERFEEMVEQLNNLLDINPYEISDWISLIRGYGSLNQLDKAIEACDFALAIDTTNEEVHMMRAVCLYENGNIELAASAFEECIPFISINIPFLLVVIQCFLELKRFDQGFEVANRILELDPTHADGYYQKAICLIGMKELGKAYETICEALGIDGDNPDFLVVKADLLTERNELVSAKEILLELAEKEPTFYKIYFPLAYIYEQEENWEQALIYYKKSYEMNDSDVVSLLKMVKLFYLCGDYEATIYHKVLLDNLIMNDSNSEILINEYLQGEYALTNEYIKLIDKSINN